MLILDKQLLIYLSKGSYFMLAFICNFSCTPFLHVNLFSCSVSICGSVYIPPTGNLPTHPEYIFLFNQFLWASFKHFVYILFLFCPFFFTVYFLISIFLAFSEIFLQDRLKQFYVLLDLKIY